MRRLVICKLIFRNLSIRRDLPDKVPDFDQSTLKSTAKAFKTGLKTKQTQHHPTKRPSQREEDSKRRLHHQFTNSVSTMQSIPMIQLIWSSVSRWGQNIRNWKWCLNIGINYRNMKWAFATKKSAHSKKSKNWLWNILSSKRNRYSLQSLNFRRYKVRYQNRKWSFKI